MILYDEEFYWNRPEDPLMSGSGQSWNNDLIVVTMNYRTGLFGFFNGSQFGIFKEPFSRENGLPLPD